ncbi:hypothetical protein HPP92_008238 [Vanilla planifolia]|uniref:Uncharacterized protein n=1 Tax=Vanilla planifolia TaxID=51239 RepID=A0A835V669_VANPL|nr:hypothetical protein HPP92_008238 [Vanilla planifolia]
MGTVTVAGAEGTEVPSSLGRLRLQTVLNLLIDSGLHLLRLRTIRDCIFAKDSTILMKKLKQLFSLQGLADLCTIWDWILVDKLHIPPEDGNLYSAVLVVPETFDNRVSYARSIVPSHP